MAPDPLITRRTMSASGGTAVHPGRIGVLEAVQPAPVFPAGELAIHRDLIAPPVEVVPVVGPLPVLKLDRARFIRPELGELIAKVRTQGGGVPRDQIGVPIAPADAVADTVLFEEPADPARKRYLPRYRVAQETVSGTTRYRMAVERQGGEWSLTIRLEKYPAPELGDAWATAAELEHGVSVLLTHQLGTGDSMAGQKEHAFDEVTLDGLGVLCAVLRGAQLSELDRIYQALTNPDFKATLIVRRTMRVGVPVPSGATVSTLWLDMFRMNRPAMLVPRALGTDMIWEGPAVAATPAEPAPPAPTFREVTRVLDDIMDQRPFVFPPSVHGYIYRDISPASAEPFGFIRRTVTGPNRAHSYFQDEAAPDTFYYLPDGFNVARRTQSPHYPVMSIRFVSTDGSLERTQVVLEYVAQPVVSARRLEDAAEELRRYLPDPLPPGMAGPRLQPLPADPGKLQFRLQLPRADAAGSLQARPAALVDLRSGIHDTLTLTFKEFQTVYAALFGGSAVLFQGDVLVPLGGERAESVPFVARMNELAGDVLDYEEAPDAASNGIKATFRNAIESPIRLRSLTAELRAGEGVTAGRIEGLNLPAELAPKAELTFVVAPATPLTGSERPHARFDLDGVEVLPDPEAVWNAVLDPMTPAEYLRAIEVRAFADTFAEREPADQTIRTILVQFERGGTIDLVPPKLSAVAQVRAPLSDFVLGKTDPGEYRYRLVLVRRQGESRDTEWRTDSLDILIPNVR